jgi:hypothetical protein
MGVALFPLAEFSYIIHGMKSTRLFPIVLTGALLLSVSARAAVYDAGLDGLHEVPPNASPATGFITVTVVSNSLTVDISWTGLIGGPAFAAHIHCCTAPGTNTGVAVGFTGFPATTSGAYLHTFDLLDSAIYTPTFLTASGGTAAGAEAALIAGLNAGTAYSNIHNATFSGGEIRGNLAAVPEPSTAILLMAGLLAAAGFLYRRNRRICRA